MSESRTISVQTEFDVFMARMQVRKLAREIGFDITSQARIALATSSLARALRLGETQEGEVSIDCLDEGGCTGVRVICTTTSGANSKLILNNFADTRWLVDELTIVELPSDDLQITLIKWRGQGGNHA